MSSSNVCGHGIFVLIVNQKRSKAVVFGNVVGVEFIFKGFKRWRILSIVWKIVPNARG